MAYVYLHTRLDTNEIFYVGISSKDDDNFKRSRSKTLRSEYWKRIVNKVGHRVDVVYRNISWEKAKEIEIKLIKLYGRIDLGLGTLVNMTDGGEGLVGNIVSEETKRKISNSLKGHVSHNKGIKLSEETKLKISNSSKGKSRIFTEEHKLKLSEANKSRIITDKTKKKISNSLKGKKHSDESKLKMKKSQITRRSEKSELNNNQIIHFMDLGLSTKEIAIEMNLSVSSIDRLKNKIKNKL